MGALAYGVDVFPVFQCTDALDDDGYVLKLNSDGTVSKASASDEVFGVNATGVVDYWGNAISPPVEVAVIPTGRGLFVYLQLDPNNLEITIGDKLCVDANTAGVVDKRDGTENTADPIAIALEARAANSGGKILAKLL